MTEEPRQAEPSCCATSTSPTVATSSPHLQGDRQAAPRETLLRATLGATVASAFAASFCCIGPMAAAFLGFTSLGAAARLHALRPYLTAVTLLSLAVAFHLTYRKRPAACEPGSPCETGRAGGMNRLSRVVLWIVAVVSLLVLTFPTWSGWIWG